MDSNGTRHHLLLGPGDWAGPLATSGADLVFDAARDAVTLAPRARVRPPRPGGALFGAGDARGADADGYGSVYWIAADRRRIRVARIGGGAAADYWSADALDAAPCAPEAGPFRPTAPAPAAHAGLSLSGLAVTDRHFLVVGTLAPGGLLVFDLHAYGPPRFEIWPEAVAFAPFAMARAPGGGLWLLDRGGRDAVPEPRLWRLDAHLAPRRDPPLLPLEADAPALFAPPGAVPEPRPAPRFPGGVTPDLGAPALPLSARALAALPDGTVLLLDTPGDGPSRVLRLRDGRLAGSAVLAAPPGAEAVLPEGVRAHALAVLPDPDAPPWEVRGVLAAADERAGQVWRFDLSAPAEGGLFLVPRTDLAPLRRWAGRGLVVWRGGAFYDIDETWTPLAVDPRRAFAGTGHVDGLVFDGAEPGCVWRRLALDGCIPPGGSVTVEARAADDLADLPAAPWRAAPAPRLRGPDPGAEAVAHVARDPARFRGSWETALAGARGRWLELRLAFAADGRSSPAIRALRVFYPRYAWLEERLPACWREDAASADFTDRFLANPEGILTAIEDHVAGAQRLLDTRTAPDDWLDWLAGWLGARLDADWEDWRRRLFIDHAELLFRWRGTAPGLLALISVSTDDCPDAELLAGLRDGRPVIVDGAGRARLVEAWITRHRGGAGWRPADGAAVLHARFAAFALSRRAPGLAGAAAVAALAAAWGRPLADDAAIRLSPVAPASPAEAEDWRAFVAGPIGFTYAEAGPGDLAAWRAFLKRRWGSAEALAAAWGLGAAPAGGLAAIDLPVEGDFPDGGARLEDWIAFVSLHVPILAAAHRLTVLAPASLGETPGAQAARAARIRAIVARERPAHVDFEVRAYWALFLVGAARLGVDTALGEGARFAAIALGRSALSEGFLGYGHPWSVDDRWVVGRDSVGRHAS